MGLLTYEEKRQIADDLAGSCGTWVAFYKIIELSEDGETEIDLQESFKRVAEALRTLPKKAKVEALALLADYGAQVSDEDLLDTIEALARSEDNDLAFSASHALAVCNKERASALYAKMLTMEDSPSRRLSLKAMALEGIG